MREWCAIALALREPEDDALASRIPTYLHPLAGRTLAWHVLRALAGLQPAASPLLLVGPPELDAAMTGEVPASLVHTTRPASWWERARTELRPGCGAVLVVDAAAPVLSASLEALVEGPTGTVLVGVDGATLAAWMEADDAEERCARGGTLIEIAEGLERVEPAAPEEAFVVRDRVALALAAAAIRDRTVAALMERGATFLAPDSVVVDVDVTVGADTVIYPGVVLEGQTSIGSETVVGPGCRIIDAQVGSGVELKGYNYIVRTRVRNRAVLEPYVRRGFD